MEFELTSELISEIVFSMENQKELFLLDSAGPVLVKSCDVPNSDPDRFYSLPVWDSLCGFRLMENFVLSVKNAVIQEKLRAVLKSGHGVFRNFKNVLKEYPEAERLWFSFKEHEMNQVILDWYNSLREIWGLEQLGAEPEEFEDLVFDDFCFRTAGETDLNTAREQELVVFDEMKNTFEPELAAFLALLNGQQKKLADFSRQTALVCETASGDFAGFASFAPCFGLSENSVLLCSLFVLPRYRGLGLGKELLQQCLKAVKQQKKHFLFAPCAGVPDFFAKTLPLMGFTKLGSIYFLDLSKTI